MPVSLVKKILIVIGIQLFVWPQSINASLLDQPNQSLSWKSWRNLSEDAYDKKLATYKKQGFRPVDVEIADGSKRSYSLIMRKDKNNPPWAIHTRLSDKAFKKKWNDYKSKGYRPIDLESYKLKSKRFYAGIWIKDGISSWASYRNYSSDEFNKKFKENKDKGRMPIDVDAYVDGNKLKFSGIFVKNVDKVKWSIKRNIKQSDFGNHFQDMTDKGYRLYDTNSYLFKGTQYYAVIWVKEKQSRRWKARRDMDSDWFHNYWARYRDAGYRLEDIEVYSTKKGKRYAGIWIENNKNRLDWKHKNTVNELVEEYLENNPSQGFSLVIYQNGQYRFRKGWGTIDSKNNKQAHSTTIYRLASVSKAVTSVLGHVLEKKKKLKLDSKIRDIISSLPNRHKYRLNQLLSIRSGVCHYDDNCDGYDGTKIDLSDKNSMWKGVKKFYKKKLSADIGDIYYSTHGYTIAANAYERKTKKSFNSLLKTYIGNPLDIDIVCEDLEQKRNERSDVFQFDDKLKTAKAKSIAWKCGGGGMEASVYDIAKLGVALEKNKLLSNSEKLAMITPPDGQLRSSKRYAEGWAIFPSTDGAPVEWYAKAGDQTGGRNYIRIYPDTDLVIALGGNTRGSGYTTLVSDIVDAITK